MQEGLLRISSGAAVESKASVEHPPEVPGVGHLLKVSLPYTVMKLHSQEKINQSNNQI